MKLGFVLGYFLSEYLNLLLVDEILFLLVSTIVHLQFHCLDVIFHMLNLLLLQLYRSLQFHDLDLVSIVELVLVQMP